MFSYQQLCQGLAHGWVTAWALVLGLPAPTRDLSICTDAVRAGLLGTGRARGRLCSKLLPLCRYQLWVPHLGPVLGTWDQRRMELARLSFPARQRCVGRGGGTVNRALVTLHRWDIILGEQWLWMGQSLSTALTRVGDWLGF